VNIAPGSPVSRRFGAEDCPQKKVNVDQKIDLLCALVRNSADTAFHELSAFVRGDLCASRQQVSCDDGF
jgi:hypothetical protein